MAKVKTGTFYLALNEEDTYGDVTVSTEKPTETREAGYWGGDKTTEYETDNGNVNTMCQNGLAETLGFTVKEGEAYKVTFKATRIGPAVKIWAAAVRAKRAKQAKKK